MTYYLLEATLNVCIRKFFLINLFSLIMAKHFYYITIDLLNWIIRKQLTDPVFDQISVRLSDATHRNMNQKYVFF